MPGPIEEGFYEIARGAARGMIEGLAEKGNLASLVAQVITSFRKAMTATLIDAPVDPARTDALQKEQSDAVAAGQLPPDSVR